MGKEEKTILDFGVTKYEWEKLLVGVPFTKELIDNYLQITPPDVKTLDIAYLFYYRNDIEQMKKYLEKLPYQQMRDSFWRTITHP